MKTCWLHRSAIRRHIEDDQALPPASQLHARSCAACAREIAEHKPLIEELSAPMPLEAPAFLRARIVHSLRAEARPRRAPNLAPRFALASLALLTAALFALNRATAPEPVTSQKPSPVIQIAEFRAPSVFSETRLDGPYEAELRNLRNDTTTALRALAANFLPARE